VAGAADQRLLSSGIADELDPEIIRGAGGPDSSKVAAEIVHTKRWMAFIGVEKPERVREALLICDTKLHE